MRFKTMLLLVLTVLLAAGTAMAAEAADDVTAMKAAKPPVIDGSIDEVWDTTEAMSALVYDNMEWEFADLTDMDIATGYTKVLWQEDTLYLLAVVTDKTMDSDAKSVTNGINFWVSETDSGKESFNEADGDWHIFCNADGGTNYYTGNKNVYGQAEMAAERTADGYIVEVAVPVMTSGFEYAAGNKIGYNISVDDDQDGDNNRDTFTSWQTYDGRPYWEKTSALNEVTLVGGEGASAGTSAADQKVPVDVVEIPEKAVTVDGVIADGEWDGATRMLLNISNTSTWTENGAGIVGTDGWSKLGHTDDDFSTELAFTVDGENLYILLTRKDSTLNFASDNYHRPYSSDCALMWFYDPDYGAQYGLQLLAANKSGTPIIGYFFMDSDQNDSVNMMEDGYAEAVTKTTADSYVMEARVDMSGMDDFGHDMLATGNIRVTWCAVNICEDGWDSDDGQHVLWGTYNYQAQYKGVNDWDNAPAAKLSGGSSSGAGTDTAASDASGAELLAKSWDTIFVDYEMMVDGNAGGWLADNPVEGPIEQVELRGWAHVSTPIKGFAYTIDGGEAVRSEDFIQDRPDVKAVIHEEAEGFDMSIELDKLAVGDHVIKIYAIDANDNLVDTTFEFPFVKEAAPEPQPAPEPEPEPEPAPEPEPEPAPEPEPEPEAPAAEEPAAETPAAETPAAEKPAEAKKSGCGSMIGGGMIVLVAVLGSAWISKRR